MIKVAVTGAAGRMGSGIIRKITEQDDMEVVAAIEMPNTPLAGRDAGIQAGTEELGVEIVGAEKLEETLKTSGAEVLVDFTIAHAAVETIKAAVRGIRNVRTGMNVPPSKKAKVIVVTENEEVKNIFENGKAFFGTLAYASEVVLQADEAGIEKDAVSTVIHQATIFMPFAELVDIAEEKARLAKEIDKLRKEVARATGMLNNPNFVSKAPEAKIQAEREKLDKYAQMLKQVEERLEALNG